MQRCFTFGPAIAHKAAGLGACSGNAVRVRTVGKQERQNSIMRQAVGCAQRSVQRCLAGIRQASIYVRTALDQELAELPVTMKCRAIEIEIIPQGIERHTLVEEKTYGTDIAVIGTPLDQ